MITPDGRLVPLVQLEDHRTNVRGEITGPAFDPSGTRLYFSSQRGTQDEYFSNGRNYIGLTYEVSGPFLVQDDDVNQA